jgi:hypothetical protein
MPKLIHQETMCCGYKNCPTIKVFEDGSMELTDNDSEKGSVGTIKLAPEQVDRLMELKAKK